MKKYSMMVSMFSIGAVLMSGLASASEWNHTEESQGHDGTLWANIPGSPSGNDAQFPLPFATCAVGSHQSPIVINLSSNPIPLTINPITQHPDNNPAAASERRADSLLVRYVPSTSSAEGSAISTDDGNAYVFRNTGHAVQISFSRGYQGRLFIGNDEYPLVQLHVHTPSEHAVVTDREPAGKQYGGELHFVHQRNDGKLAVLGIFLDNSKPYADNFILKRIIENTPKKHDAFNQTGAGLSLDPSKLIPTDGDQVFTYAGSLTTPPCSEGVSWYVLSTPLKVAPAQIQQLQAFFPANSRIVQNTATRTVNIHKDVHVAQ